MGAGGLNSGGFSLLRRQVSGARVFRSGPSAHCDSSSPPCFGGVLGPRDTPYGLAGSPVSQLCRLRRGVRSRGQAATVIAGDVKFVVAAESRLNLLASRQEFADALPAGEFARMFSKFRGGGAPGLVQGSAPIGGWRSAPFAARPQTRHCAAFRTRLSSTLRAATVFGTRARRRSASAPRRRRSGQPRHGTRGRAPSLPLPLPGHTARPFGTRSGGGGGTAVGAHRGPAFSASGAAPRSRPATPSPIMCNPSLGTWPLCPTRTSRRCALAPHAGSRP